MSRRHLDIWVLSIRKQFGLERQAWGCQSTYLPGQVTQEGKAMGGEWSTKKHIHVHEDGGGMHRRCVGGPETAREEGTREVGGQLGVPGALEVDRERSLRGGRGQSTKPTRGGVGWGPRLPMWDVEVPGATSGNHLHGAARQGQMAVG